jgi:Haem-binding domain
MRRVVLRIGLVFLALLLAIQLWQPDRTNPPVDRSQTLDRHVVVPADVKAVLDRACRDCHSHETRWPFYAYVSRRFHGISPSTSGKGAST